MKRHWDSAGNYYAEKYACKNCKDKGVYFLPGKQIRVQVFCHCQTGKTLKEKEG